jgi:three-Cys-motif partner protein
MLWNFMRQNLLSDSKWLMQKIQDMVNAADAFKSICPKVLYDTGAWSTIKLLIILNYIPIYTKIIPKYFNFMYYIEPLAGSGLCRIRETGDIIAGSTLIAATFCYSPFNKYFLIEKDKRRAQALETRMKTITPDVRVIQEDCNDCLKGVMNRLPKRSHYLAFVDCEGLEVDWKTMDYLLNKPGDLLFTFQSQFVARVRGKAVKGSIGDQARLNRFYGDNRWLTCASPEKLVLAYIEKLMKRRSIVLPIHVKGPRGFQYYVIYATKRTKTGSPWIRGIIYLKRKVEACDYKWVKGILDVLTGRQLMLNNLI